MKYLVICTINSQDKNAFEFSSRHEAVSYVANVMDYLGYTPDPAENEEGEWRISEGATRVRFQLEKLEASAISYWLRLTHDVAHIETRRFKSRNVAVEYAERQFGEQDSSVRDSAFGLWQKNVNSKNVELGLSLIVEETKRNAEDCRILGVSDDADEDVIKAAYRAKLKKLHPDVGGSDEDVKRLTAAYKRLTNTDGGKVRRIEYTNVEAEALKRYLITLFPATVTNDVQQAEPSAPGPKKKSILSQIGSAVSTIVIILVVIGAARGVGSILGGGSSSSNSTPSLRELSDSEFRAKYVSGCTTTAAEEPVEGLDTELYCGCVVDDGVALLGRDEFIKEDQRMLKQGADIENSSVKDVVYTCLRNQGFDV